MEGLGERSWINNDNHIGDAYIKGLKRFIVFATNNGAMKEIRCPCRNCSNRRYLPHDELESHLIAHGMLKGYTCWDLHGEVHQVNTTQFSVSTAPLIETLHNEESTKKNITEMTRKHRMKGLEEEVVDENPAEDAPHDKTVSALWTPLCMKVALKHYFSCVVWFFKWKTDQNVTDKGLADAFRLLKRTAPQPNHVPSSIKEAKKILDQALLLSDTNRQGKVDEKDQINAARRGGKQSKRGGKRGRERS